ncbi:MAG TPA: AarF/ABC1/UbiB kinase family protein [Pyrinomonadaceae bacterium]|jgi:predicted unusual protein kinase regulating ubiquinone biosynthesis (AarF/ABC1/UbiB family)
MAISLKPENLKRYKDVAVLLMKYGRSDIVKNAGLDDILKEESATITEAPKAEELARDLEQMGPTFIKLGQLLSTRSDLLPYPYLEALTRLQDKVEPFSFAEVEEIVTNELGVRMSKAFAEFSATPMAAASLGQVHRAELRDGREVAVKVQRPGIRERIVQDLDSLLEIASMLDKHTKAGQRYEFSSMLEEFRKSLLQELDYRQEARNLITFADNLNEFEDIVVPRPIEDYTTSRLLTMEYIKGRKITTLSPLARIDIDGDSLADELFRAYLKQILVDGFFHADPHPGNVFLTDDNRIAIIDLGMVARITPRLQENLLQLLLAISEGRGEEAATQAIKMGEAKANFDEAKFRREVGEMVVRHQNSQLSDINAGQVALEMTRVSGENGFRLPPDITMMAKALLNLDQVGQTLSPRFDINASIRRNASQIMQQRMMKSLSPGNIFASMIETKDFLERLPGRINHLLDMIARNELKINADVIDEKSLLEGIQKIANRITLGILLASLIVGAALIMRVETSFRLFGYPGLAVIFFLIAAIGAIALALNIVFTDVSRKKKPDEE